MNLFRQIPDIIKKADDFSGIEEPENKNDQNGLRYAEFVVPLVKAVQEQQEIINSFLKLIEILENK